MCPWLNFFDLVFYFVPNVYFLFFLYFDIEKWHVYIYVCRAYCLWYWCCSEQKPEKNRCRLYSKHIKASAEINPSTKSCLVMSSLSQLAAIPFLFVHRVMFARPIRIRFWSISNCKAWRFCFHTCIFRLENLFKCLLTFPWMNALYDYTFSTADIGQNKIQ